MSNTEKDDAWLKEQADKWMQWDQNEETRKEMQTLIDADDKEELRARLGKRIAFGTAGLRGKMRAGFSAMNDLTVIQASQGFVTYLQEVDSDLKKKGIVIGYDGRYNSTKFARLAAATFISKGVPVKMFNQVVATPLVPFAVLHYGLSAGLMVTASHNPKEDNGYKVYWDTGCQIVSPIDKGISSAIEANLEPWKIDHEEVCKTSDLLTDPTEELAKAYFERVSKLTTLQKTNAEVGKAHGPVVFTAMHGVGKRWVAEAFESFGLPPYVAVQEQIDPDPEFSTVDFPNPEEGAGALLLSFKTAERSNARLILANDPDSDRLAVAERIEPYPNAEPDAKKQKLAETSDEELMKRWKVFTGNDIGILLGHYCYQRLLAEEPDVDKSKVLVINTTVSSKMLKAMAEKEGINYEETLTGFKWIGTAAIRAIKEKGWRFLFGFEEAIGNMVGDICFDKDGVRGAAVFAEMALGLYAKGETVQSHLAELAKKYGYFFQRNGYFFCHEDDVKQKIFSKIRTTSPEGGLDAYPKSVGRFKIKDVRDLTTGFDSQQDDNKAILPLSSSHMISFYFENGASATIRCSGTEPKIKYYIELGGDDPKQTEADLKELSDGLLEQFFEPKNNLKGN